MKKRWNFSDKSKAAVALEALRGDKTVQDHFTPHVPAGEHGALVETARR